MSKDATDCKIVVCSCANGCNTTKTLTGTKAPIETNSSIEISIEENRANRPI